MKSAKGLPKEQQQAKETGLAKDALASPSLLMTVPQVAQQMGLSPAMVYKLILTEGLPTVKLGRSTRIVYASLVVWLLAREDAQRFVSREGGILYDSSRH